MTQMNWPGNLLRRCGVAVLALLLCASLGIHAQAGASRVLRVAFPQVLGLTETAKDGTRHGLVVDYLNEIAKYTGWQYEYIDVANGEELLERFMDGEFDLMGGNYYMPGLEEYYGYPDFNMGYSRSALLARRDDWSIHTNYLESLNGKTIGVYGRAVENIRRLREFLSINNLDCPIREYGYEQLSEEGNLYDYLLSGEVDLLLGNFAEQNNEFRVVTSYDAQPYYIVTTPGNQEVLDGLNMALESITDSNPNFGTERFAANFNSMAADILLDGQELAYIRDKQTVTVAVPEDWHPLSCETRPESHHNGVVPDVLEKIETYTGLRFSLTYTESYAEAIRMVQDGQADILGFYLDSEELAAKQGLSVTAPYTNLNNILVRNKASNYPGDGLVGSVVEGRTLPANILAAEKREYPDIREALKAVNRGEIDFVYGLANQIESEIQHSYLSNVVPVSLVNDTVSVGFALPRPADTTLLTVLNKAINSLDAAEKAELLQRNIVSIGVTQFSLKALVYANPLLFAAILAAILLLAVTVVAVIARSRMRAARMQGELEKAEASSKAKGEFLSRMSHEIRTPMNAVVGLADLTSMMENLPEEARENLRKLRTSSQYLLSLINDILDMSRIENGKLAMASEPFSLQRLLDDLRSMMDVEAQRRGLTFDMEAELTHTGLTGDAIRLRQVLVNLLSNAFKFTPAGGTVRLLVQETGATKEGAAFTFQVTDTGVGISAEDQKRIFASFEQVGASSSKSQGTGLGLAISASIVRMMGGELQVKSCLGEGSTFYFTAALPYGEAAPEPKLEVRADGHILEGLSVLMAEDNDLNAEIATELLQMQGAKVCRAENGAVAVERFRASQPGAFKVILMDVQMPEMDGMEASRAIRALPRPDAAAIPIIAMTANTFQEDVDAARAAGMTDFLPKPLDVKHLYHVLQNLMEISR